MHLLKVGNVLESQMEPSQHWYDPGSRQEEGSEAGAEEEEEAEGQEDPYAFTEIQDSEYDTVLACSRSTKKKTRSRSFIVNRPPAPAPRPPMSPLREETTPYIAQGKGLLLWGEGLLPAPNLPKRNNVFKSR